MRLPHFIANAFARRTMRRGIRAAVLERDRAIAHDCSQHYGEGRWYSDGSLRFRCGLCGCTKHARPQASAWRIVGVVALWALILAAVLFLIYM